MFIRESPVELEKLVKNRRGFHCLGLFAKRKDLTFIFSIQSTAAWVHWHTPVNPSSQKGRAEDWELQDTLGHMMIPCLKKEKKRHYMKDERSDLASWRRDDYTAESPVIYLMI